MELEQYNISVDQVQYSSLKDILTRYIFHWKWFVISLICSFLFGFVYLRYQVPQYEASAKILIKDENKGTISDELSAFEDLGILNGKKNIDNEIEILKSRTLMKRVVKELKLNISYFSFGRPIEHERYHDSPIELIYKLNDSTKTNLYGNWHLIPENNNNFTLKNGQNGDVTGKYKFGQLIKTDFGSITFKSNDNLKETYLNKPFRVILTNEEETVDKYISLIQINPISKNSTGIIISLQDAIEDKAETIINNLILQHNLDAINDKNQVSRNTVNFINERIKYITEELSDVEGEAENYKNTNKISDIESQSRIYLESGRDNEAKLLEATTQLKITEFIKDYLTKNSKTYELVPHNLGLNDFSVSNQINDYNKLILEKNRLLKYSGEQNPLLINLENEIVNLRKSLTESVNNLHYANKIKASELLKQEDEIVSKISNVPKIEKEYRSIIRQQKIKEELYLYLLQKREEANIALAVTVSNAKIIDKAYGNGFPVSPKKEIIFLSSLIFGFLLPIIILYLIDLLDTKVHGKKETDMVNLPYLGEIPETKQTNKLVVVENNRNNMAEAFRIVRSNVEFLNSKIQTNCKVVFITSTIGKEGKSFIALNLAASFALTGKKILLAGFDLRNPKILKYMNSDEKLGVTNFIIDKSLQLDDVVFSVQGFTHFNILPSGPIPPNPAELLMSDRVADIFAFAKEKYDYVIVDTAPVGLVAATVS